MKNKKILIIVIIVSSILVILWLCQYLNFNVFLLRRPFARYENEHAATHTNIFTSNGNELYFHLSQYDNLEEEIHRYIGEPYKTYANDEYGWYYPTGRSDSKYLIYVDSCGVASIWGDIVRNPKTADNSPVCD